MPELTDDNLDIRRIQGIDQPTQIAFLGDNDLLVTEKTGNVVRVQNGQVRGSVLQLRTNHADERGVLGITLHPNFDQNGWVYIFWTWTGEGNVPNGLTGQGSDDIDKVADLGNRVDRFRWDGSRLEFDCNVIQLPSLTTQVTTGQMRGNHNAGVIKFGPDDKLYVSIGDQNQRFELTNVETGRRVQGPGDLMAAILRLNDDGTVPNDNPFRRENEHLAKVYVYGIRNTFGFDFDPETDDLWLQTNGQRSFDVIGRYEAGDNVGWIQILAPPDRFTDYKQLELDTERQLDNPEFPPDRLADTSQEAIDRLVLFPGAQYREPLFGWRYGVAPAGLGFVRGTALGTEYEGVLLVGDVNTGSIYLFRLTGNRTDLDLDGPLADRVNDNSPNDLVGEQRGRLFGEGFMVATDIKVGPDGSLWIASLGLDSIYQITRR
jgi:aldose sugar dehydrogenase